MNKELPEAASQTENVPKTTEGATLETAYENLDQSQSQDSRDLVIDEKYNKDTEEENDDPGKQHNFAFKRICSKEDENISEVSVVTKRNADVAKGSCDSPIIENSVSTDNGDIYVTIHNAADENLSDKEGIIQDEEKNETVENDSIIEIDDEDDESIRPEPCSTNMTVEETVQTPQGDISTNEQNDEIPSISETERKDEGGTLLEEVPSQAPQSVQPSDEDIGVYVFYNKECINCECPREHKQFYRAPQFALSHFNVARKKFKRQFVCSDCHDKALETYEEFCGLLHAKLPLPLNSHICGRQEFVEIIDSSDEENDDNVPERADDEAHLSEAYRELVATELESVIKDVLQDVEIQQQLTWCKSILTTRLQQVTEENTAIDKELRALQKRADKMHTSLYQSSKMKIRQLQPLDLNTGRPYMAMESAVPKLPPMGEIQRPKIQLNDLYYAVKNKAIASWVPSKVIEPFDGVQKSLKHYKVKFLKSQHSMLKTVSVKHLAYFEPPPVQLPLGTRVIAYFDASSLSRSKEKMMIQSAFYPGIIAEPLKPNNKYRYLIFYDDGYTQYVYHDDVRLVCHVSENVWDDVHPGSRDFIQKYLTQYSINRPMVQTQKGQNMATESNGKWMYARVVDIDCSLIQMQFDGPRTHTEWIYRGSLRLGPVFKEYHKSVQKTTTPTSRLPRRTEPFIRYTEDEETSTNQQRERNVEARAVAKKSVSRQESSSSLTAHTQAPVPVVRHLNNSTIYVEDENKPRGKVVFYTAKRNLPPRAYKPHICTSLCPFQISHSLHTYSPLSKPLLSGWERMIMRQKIKKVITYRAPCGKIVRSMRELHEYLRCTDNSLNVDNFDFSPDINCLAEYVIESAFINKRDISDGQEKMPIPLVNYYDNTMPPECKYAEQRIPTEGVNLNTGEEFLVGCDCEGDCSDKETCSCWQLTYAGAKYGNPNTPVDEIGYQYKRLYEHVPTGIYECNSRCKCKANCLNRVVQQSLQMKLQVFKTSNRGWGLRCLNDIPRGSFICIYAGHLLTEAKANEGGLDAGDEYFAELDYIEVAEQIKEGYESDVESAEPDEEVDVYTPDHDDDDEFTPNKSYNSRSKKMQKMLANRGGNQAQNAEEDSQERQVINFNPNAEMSENSIRESSIRKLFGKDEACYVMDAKITGNLGRYFNHSCSPNLFVQNVFVDTHDLRFPWVAFFANTNIRAGSELTWNYNYEVGVVPGKVLYCQCGAPNCRIRLL